MFSLSGGVPTEVAERSVSSEEARPTVRGAEKLQQWNPEQYRQHPQNTRRKILLHCNFQSNTVQITWDENASREFSRITKFLLRSR
jgi:hypothetical protein